MKTYRIYVPVEFDASVCVVAESEEDAIAQLQAHNEGMDNRITEEAIEYDNRFRNLYFRLTDVAAIELEEENNEP